MSVVTDGALNDPVVSHFHELRPGDPCFLCGDMLSLPYVLWSGITAQIALHPRCARQLGANLIDDGTRADDLPVGDG